MAALRTILTRTEPPTANDVAQAVAADLADVAAAFATPTPGAWGNGLPENLRRLKRQVAMRLLADAMGGDEATVILSLAKLDVWNVRAEDAILYAEDALAAMKRIHGECEDRFMEVAG